MFRRILLLFLVIAIISACSASDLDITSRHGETWIIWNWTVPTAFIDNDTYIGVAVDGVTTHAMIASSNTTVPTNYYLTGVNANEQHALRVWVYNTTSIFIDEQSIVSTGQSSGYNYIIFIISLILMIIAVFLKSRIMGVVFTSISISLFLFMSVMMSVENPSFSTVNLIFSVVGGFIVIYLLYTIWIKHSTWESD